MASNRRSDRHHQTPHRMQPPPPPPPIESSCRFCSFLECSCVCVCVCAPVCTCSTLAVHSVHCRSIYGLFWIVHCITLSFPLPLLVDMRSNCSVCATKWINVSRENLKYFHNKYWLLRAMPLCPSNLSHSHFLFLFPSQIFLFYFSRIWCDEVRVNLITFNLAKHETVHNSPVCSWRRKNIFFVQKTFSFSLLVCFRRKSFRCGFCVLHFLRSIRILGQRRR